MRYVAAYLLAQLGGNDAPEAAASKAILGRYFFKLLFLIRKKLYTHEFFDCANSYEFRHFMFLGSGHMITKGQECRR